MSSAWRYNKITRIFLLISSATCAICLKYPHLRTLCRFNSSSRTYRLKTSTNNLSGHSHDITIQLHRKCLLVSAADAFRNKYLYLVQFCPYNSSSRTYRLTISTVVVNFNILLCSQNDSTIQLIGYISWSSHLPVHFVTKISWLFCQCNSGSCKYWWNIPTSVANSNVL